MADCMMFPEDWRDFLKDYSFTDSEQVYTNGSELIQVFRVEQLIEHLLKEQEPKPVRLEKFPVNEPLSHCPACGIELNSFIHQSSGIRPKYCPMCGQEVKWDV